MRRVPVALALAVLSAMCALGATAGVSAGAPIRANLMDIEQDVMCTSCHEPLELVQSPQALAEKQYIQTLIAQGDTKSEILHDLVEQYGVAVLGKPPASGFNLLIYILPPALLVGGIAFLIITLPRWRARARAAAPLPGARPLSPDDARRIDDELERMI